MLIAIISMLGAVLLLQFALIGHIVDVKKYLNELADRGWH